MLIQLIKVVCRPYTQHDSGLCPVYDPVRPGGWQWPLPCYDSVRPGGWQWPLPRYDPVRPGGWQWPLPCYDPVRQGGWQWPLPRLWPREAGRLTVAVALLWLCEAGRLRPPACICPSAPTRCFIATGQLHDPQLSDGPNWAHAPIITHWRAGKYKTVTPWPQGRNLYLKSSLWPMTTMTFLNWGSHVEITHLYSVAPGSLRSGALSAVWLGRAGYDLTSILFSLHGTLSALDRGHFHCQVLLHSHF